MLDDEALAVVGRDRFERAVLMLNVDEVGQRDVVQRLAERVAADLHETRGILIRQRTPEDRVDDGEDGGVGADAKRERRHNGCRERALA